ncbi:MAG: hypothetical protein PHZ04_04140 [Patescibacteria group bacterium]|nr:hypothetical protein [Patescibacteria group bacterium]MDD5295133.1 hypothetical protein [Patescibacteria group bacterium]MDD5554014.1 hypothetical protein [Patescibacteria group bacterium]
MPNKKFLLSFLFLPFLIFGLVGCGKKQPADTGILPEGKSQEDQPAQRGYLQSDTGEGNIEENTGAIKEIPKNKEDLKKYLEDLEKDSDKIDINAEEEDAVIDDSGIDDSDVNIEEDNDVDDSDIDAL